jgi:hypothetical protein
MSTTVIEYPGYEAICPWHHRQPFDGVEQYPTVITRADAPVPVVVAGAGNSTPSWMYVGTKRVNCGTFYVQPGGWFDPGNHPNPEPYYILGNAHLPEPRHLRRDRGAGRRGVEHPGPRLSPRLELRQGGV